MFAESMFGRSIRADAAECARILPGDCLIPDPLATLNHAITIRCPRHRVWPWIAQMGAGSRAGWYSYDWLDNGGRQSAVRIVPELQPIVNGMTFPALPGAADGFKLLAFVPEQFLVLGWPAPDGSARVTWAFVLDDIGPGATRLLVRARGAREYSFLGLPPRASVWAASAVHFVMERKQLLTIARRAETSVSPASSASRCGGV